MKKNYICTLLLAIIAIFSTMKAQAQEFHFMPKVGFSLATLMGLGWQCPFRCERWR